jgi:hypothetical protein
VSLQSSSSQPADDAVQKQKLNVYTVMLIVAFVALLTACLLLYLELRQYGSMPWWKTEGAQPTPVLQLDGPLAPRQFQGGRALL